MGRMEYVQDDLDLPSPNCMILVLQWKVSAESRKQRKKWQTCPEALHGLQEAWEKTREKSCPRATRKTSRRPSCRLRCRFDLSAAAWSALHEVFAIYPTKKGSCNKTVCTTSIQTAHLKALLQGLDLVPGKKLFLLSGCGVGALCYDLPGMHSTRSNIELFCSARRSTRAPATRETVRFGLE